MRNTIYELPEKIPAREILLDSDLDLKAYDDFVLSNYESETARTTLRKFNSNGTEITGSSPFMNTALAFMDPKNPGFFSNGKKLGSREDIEAMVKKQPTYFDGIYADFGLALVTPYDNWKNDDEKKPNDLLAKNLAQQLEKREITLPEKGLLIPLSVLAKPKEYSNSAYGLTLEINPELDTNTLKDQLKDISSYNWDWTRDEGLARAFRGDRGWNRYYRGLGNSDSGGRVVWDGVVDTPKNLGLGHSDEEWKSAFDSANVSGIYELVKGELQDN